VTSDTTREFRRRLAALSPEVRAYAKRVYARWRRDPWHPSLQFKPVHQTLPIYSVRIGLHWRAIGVKRHDTVVWFWIGSHKDYDRKVEELRRSR
jgi:hypothetical protein